MTPGQISLLTIAELASGIHHDEPLIAAARGARYRKVLNEFDPVRYSAQAAHLYGAILPRPVDLMLASVAAELDAALLTRNPDDFVGIEDIAHVIAI